MHPLTSPEEIRKYFETNADGKHNFSKSTDEAKAVLTEKFIATQEKSLKNYPTALGISKRRSNKAQTEWKERNKNNQEKMNKLVIKKKNRKYQ